MKSSFRRAYIDVFGTIIDGSDVIPGSNEFLAALVKKGVDIYLLSNNSLYDTEYFILLLDYFGINIPESHIITGSKMLITYLKKHLIKNICIVGEKDFINEISSAGINIKKYEDHGKEKVSKMKLFKNINGVVVAQDKSFAIQKQSLLGRYVRELSVPLIAVGCDRVFPMSKTDFIPGAYPMAVCSATPAECEIVVIGKPNFTTISDLINTEDPSNTIVIGDNPFSDVQFAKNAGFKSAIIRTGVSSGEEDIEGPKPDYVVKSIDELIDLFWIKLVFC